jgi:hypothetical protein
MLELDFYKIKKISYEFDRTDQHLKLILELNTPANARKNLSKNTNYVRSPMNMHA